MGGRRHRRCDTRPSTAACDCAPRHRMRSASPRSRAVSSRRGSSGPPPMWTSCQCSPDGSRARACSRSSNPFLSTARPTARSVTADAESRPSCAGRVLCGSGKPRGVDAVIVEGDSLRRAGKIAQVPGIGIGARGDPRARRQLFPLLPVGRSPDVLGVSGAAPREPAQQRRVSRDRRRACAGSARAGGRRCAAAPRLEPAPARSGGCGCASDRAADRATTPPGQHDTPAARAHGATHARRAAARRGGTREGRRRKHGFRRGSGASRGRSDGAAKRARGRRRAAPARAAPAR